MKYKSLKIAVINGKVYSVGDEVELEEREAKKYLEAGYVKPADETTEATEPETTTEAKAKKGK